MQSSTFPPTPTIGEHNIATAAAPTAWHLCVASENGYSDDMSTYFLNKTAANRVSSATERINEQFPSRSTPTVMKASTPTVCLRSGGRRELAQSPMDPQTSIFQVAIGQQQLEKSK